MTNSQKGSKRMSFEFADRLATLRRDSGYSQEALASQLGLSRQAISKWERGESQPDTANLVTLADLYGISLDELVRGPSPEKDNETPITEELQKPADGKIEVAVKSETEAPAIPGGYGAPPRDLRPDSQEPPSSSQSQAQDQTQSQSQPQCSQPVPPQPPTMADKPANPMMSFPYPLLVVCVYLLIGFAFGWWHPGWIIFLTIPWYYWIATVVGNDPNYRNRHNYPQD